MASFNDTVIEKFRANGGVVGAPWEGKTLVLLHTVGRRTGKQNINPLVAAPVGDDYVICGSQGGAPTDPQWIANLEAASGPATVELGTETVKADYTVVRAGDADWEQLYGAWRAYWPAAADYEQKTDRKFPVVRLHVQH
ncbi:nitroreductase/quinone reductase family protein [Dactylosporangium sp. NPDC049525]|uniref:nitroreductase/quinone reductase family protein n=1 Tax=Dactylosporangium sp. NPDC049525 TaxID=3154730 RepID=UPI0034163593